MAYHSQQGVDTAIVRIFNTYGPRMRPHDGRAIPNFIRQALANEPLTVFGDGSQTRSFCYVDDLIRGLVLLAESGEHLPVNIGNPGEFTILELAQTVLEGDGLEQRDRVRGAAGGRSADPPARHHPRARSCSAGSRRSSSRTGCGACCRRTGGARRCLSAWRVLAATLAAAAGLCVPAADRARVAAPNMSDRHLRRGRRPSSATSTRSSRSTRRSHVGVLRVNLYWGGPLGVAKSPAVRGERPARRAYDWALYDRTVLYAPRTGSRCCSRSRARRGGRTAARAQPAADELRDLRDFAYAAAARYSGTYVGARTAGCCPPVRLLGGLERAEQPDLPPAAVRQARRASG